jgi:UDP-2,3-diacylglucosamine pyrophosphatase LpxH
MKIDALFISDVHLGSKGSNADKVLEIVKNK